MDILKNYNDALEGIYDHIGFVEDWVVLPIDDRSSYYWRVLDGEEVQYADEAIDLDEDSDSHGNHYSDEIYTQRFYNKHVFEGKEYTGIMVDTHCDGNRFLAIFNNKLKVEE